MMDIREVAKRQPMTPLDLHGAVLQIKIRSSLYRNDNPYSHPDPRVREELISQAQQQVGYDRESDTRVRGAIIFACGMLNAADGARKLVEGISFVARNNNWLNVMWTSEHLAEMFGPLLDMAWKEYAGMKFVNHRWPGKKTAS
jgi:hypothetical protein